jgi:hypothetical protein
LGYHNYYSILFMKNHLVFQRKETPRQGAKLKLRGKKDDIYELWKLMIAKLIFLKSLSSLTFRCSRKSFTQSI